MALKESRILHLKLMLQGLRKSAIKPFQLLQPEQGKRRLSGINTFIIHNQQGTETTFSGEGGWAGHFLPNI